MITACFLMEFIKMISNCKGFCSGTQQTDEHEYLRMDTAKMEADLNNVFSGLQLILNELSPVINKLPLEAARQPAVEPEPSDLNAQPSRIKKQLKF